MQQWLRECYVRIGKTDGLEINGLRIVFEVSRSLDSDPNTAEIHIYNLNNQTRDRIAKEFERVELYCGYNGSAEMVYRGDIRSANTYRDGADLVTVVFSGDGDEALKKSTVNKVMPASDNTAKTVVLELAKTFKLPIGDVSGLDNLPGYNRALVLSGSTKSRLDMLAKRYDFQWSIQSGAFEATKRDAAIGEVFSVNPDSGLVGIPEMQEEGFIGFKCLLNPRILPGRVVEVSADTASGSSADSTNRTAKFEGGQFKVESLKFTGDNLRGDFLCVVEKARRMINGKAVLTQFEQDRAIKLKARKSR